MAVKQWAAGDVLAAADMNSWTVPVYLYKTAATSRTSNTTLTADPHLVAPMAANAMYDLTCLLDYDSDAAADFKAQFTLPAGATMQYAWAGFTSSDVQTFNGTNSAATVVTVGGAGIGGANGRGIFILGSIVTSSTAGSLGVNWAQGSSVAIATTLHQWSYIKLFRVS